MVADRRCEGGEGDSHEDNEAWLGLRISMYIEKKIWVLVIVTSSLLRDTEMQPNASFDCFENMLTSRCPCPHIDKLDFKGASHKGLDGGVVILFGENGDDFSLQL